MLSSQAAPSIKTFEDFCIQIKKFKQENPGLNLIFLLEDNIAVLSQLVETYAEIDWLKTEEETKIINEFNAKRRKHNLYKIFDLHSLQPSTSLHDASNINRNIIKAHDILDYEDLIRKLTDTTLKEHLFTRLSQKVSGLSERECEEFAAIQAAWERRKHLAFLASPSLREVEKILDQFANYIRIIDQHFLQKTGYSQRAYEYWQGITEDKKSAFNNLVNQVKYMLALEREKLAQAMISRLQLVPREHLIAAASNAKENRELFYDDVVLQTLVELQKFGIPQEKIDRFKRVARCTLTYGLMRAFFQVIVAYGNENHKFILSELFNGANHYPENGPARAGDNSTPSVKPAEQKENCAEDKPRILSDELVEKIFPQIKSAAGRYFSPERFRDYAVLYAAFIEKTLKCIEDNGLDFDLSKACEQVFIYLVNQHIRKIAETTFRNPEDEIFQENFVKLAEYFSLGMQAGHTLFDADVVDRSKQYIFAMKQAADSMCDYARSKGSDEQGIKNVVKLFIRVASDTIIKQQCGMEDAMMEARLEVYVYIQKDVLRRMGLEERLLDNFAETCKRNVKCDEHWTAAGGGQLCRQVELEKKFIACKHNLTQLIRKESTRVKSSLQEHSMFTSQEKTLDKAAALEVAARKVEEVNSLSELKRVANELMLDRSIVQPRGRLSFFDIQSTSNNNLRDQVGVINRLG